jgi:ABC-type sugar transport system substrate-binding protein
MSRIHSRDSSRRLKLMLIATVAAIALAGCGSSGATSKGGGAAASYPTASEAQMSEVAAHAFNPRVDVASLPQEVRTAIASGATPLTPTQQKIWDNCIGQAICDTGQGTKTVALIDPLTIPYYNIQYGDVIAQAIQSGQVRKIIRTVGAETATYLAAFRQAITQRVDFILSDFTDASTVGPVLAQAKAAGIPVINGPTAVDEAFGKNLGAVIRASQCDMWKNAAITLTDHLKAQSVTNPTYAFFSGPAGNSYAPTWQPCAEEDTTSLGWKKVYTGNNVWDPQGQSQAAAALLASGKDPDVILTDIAPTQFVQAYIKAGKKLPLIMVSGSVGMDGYTAYKDAAKGGHNPDIWFSSPQVWIMRASLIAGLELADGKKPSANPVTYPLNAVAFADVGKNIDTSLSGTVTLGSLLPVADQNEAVKH